MQNRMDENTSSVYAESDLIEIPSQVGISHDLPPHDVYKKSPTTSHWSL